MLYGHLDGRSGAGPVVTHPRHLGRFSSVDFHSWSLFGNRSWQEFAARQRVPISVPTLGFLHLGYLFEWYRKKKTRRLFAPSCGFTSKFLVCVELTDRKEKCDGEGKTTQQNTTMAHFLLHVKDRDWNVARWWNSQTFFRWGRYSLTVCLW